MTRTHRAVRVLVLAGTFAVMMLIWYAMSCQGTPTPELSPITTMSLEEVPGAIGYIAFTVTEGITGTIYITRELRQAGQILAVQIYTVPVNTNGISTDTVLSPSLCPPWEIALNEPAEVWTKANLVYKALRGTVIMRIDGVGYADLNTPLPEVGGFYMTRRIEVYKMFLPLIFR